MAWFRSMTPLSQHGYDVTVQTKCPVLYAQGLLFVVRLQSPLLHGILELSLFQPCIKFPFLPLQEQRKGLMWHFSHIHRRKPVCLLCAGQQLTWPLTGLHSRKRAMTVLFNDRGLLWWGANGQVQRLYLFRLKIVFSIANSSMVKEYTHNRPD